MSKIPVEQLVERSIGLFKRYKPALEYLFAVNLDGLNIKGPETLLEDALHCLRYIQEKSGQDEESYRRSVTDKVASIMRYDYATYFVPADTIYIVCTSPEPEDDVAKYLIHETGHTIHHKLIEDGRAKKVDSIPLSKAVGDGFAEYIALETFAPYYNLPGIEEYLRGLRAHSERRFADYVEIVKPDCSHSSLSNCSISRPPKPAWMVKQQKRILDTYLYDAGYIFFKTAADAGISPLDILRNPPRDLETILNPAEYIKEMSL